jgi:hypothetical protein
MPFSFVCPHCHLKSLVEDRYAGQTGPCAGCGKQITLPARKGAIADPAPPQAQGARPGLLPSQALVIRLLVSVVLLVLVGGGVAFFSMPVIKRAAAFRNRNACLHNMQQIVTALNSYAVKYGSYPPPVVVDSTGAPLYSWRVLILPELGYQSVYDAIDKSQPWNSITNNQVIQLMPEVFASPGSPDAFALKESNYVLLTGPGTLFPKSGPIPKTSIGDSLDQTILLTETTNSMCWTQPGDSIDISNGVQLGVRASTDLGGNHEGYANVVTVSGVAMSLPSTISPALLDALISANGREEVDTSSLASP